MRILYPTSSQKKIIDQSRTKTTVDINDFMAKVVSNLRHDLSGMSNCKNRLVNIKRDARFKIECQYK